MSSMADEEITKRIAELDVERGRLTDLLRANRERRLAEKRERGFTIPDLVFAAGSRCPCGALLAYPRDIGSDGSWSCARTLLEPSTCGASHQEPLPFMFWAVKSRSASEPAPTVAFVLGLQD